MEVNTHQAPKHLRSSAIANVGIAFAFAGAIGLAVWVTESAMPLFAFMLMPTFNVKVKTRKKAEGDE